MIKKLLSLVPTFGILLSLIPALPANASTTINIGNYVQMGSYYGDPILWRCVDIDENGPLMLSDRILTLKTFDAGGNHTYLDGTTQAEPYRTGEGSNLWETSNMRSWLNSTATAGNVTWLDGCPPTADKVSEGYNAYTNEKGFLAEGNFTSNERNTIKSVTQKSLLNNQDVSKLSIGGTADLIWVNDISTLVQNYDTAYYDNVTDAMFLLDVKQLNKVYQNSSILGANYWRGMPIQKAIDNSNYKDNSLTTSNYWYNWTRSPAASSGDPDCLRIVHSDGTVMDRLAYRGYVGTRPAFYINLSSTTFTSGNGAVGTPYVVAATPINTPTPTPAFILGDVNGDGKINSVDALLTLQAASGRRTLTPSQMLAADVNLSGSVNSADALLILQVASGRRAHF